MSSAASPNRVQPGLPSRNPSSRIDGILNSSRGVVLKVNARPRCDKDSSVFNSGRFHLHVSFAVCPLQCVLRFDAGYTRELDVVGATVLLWIEQQRLEASRHYFGVQLLCFTGLLDTNSGRLLSLFWKVPGALTGLLLRHRTSLTHSLSLLRYYHSWSAHGVVSRMDEMFGVGLC